MKKRRQQRKKGNKKNRYFSKFSNFLIFSSSEETNNIIVSFSIWIYLSFVSSERERSKIVFVPKITEQNRTKKGVELSLIICFLSIFESLSCFREMEEDSIT